MPKDPNKYTFDERIASMETMSRFHRFMAINATGVELARWHDYFGSQSTKTDLAASFAINNNGGRLDEEMISEMEDKYGSKDWSYRIGGSDPTKKRAAKRKRAAQKKAAKKW